MEGGADRRARWTGECPIVQLQVDKVVPLKHPCVRLPVRYAINVRTVTCKLSEAGCELNALCWALVGLWQAL